MTSRTRISRLQLAKTKAGFGMLNLDLIHFCRFNTVHLTNFLAIITSNQSKFTYMF